MFQKQIVKRDRELLDSYHDKRCIVCGRTGCDPAHIKSSKSGGPDEAWNLAPLCRIHHTESHKIGWFMFAKKYNKVYNYLLSLGWKFEEQFGVTKLVRD